MGKLLNTVIFNGMCFWFKLRDWRVPPKSVLSEAGIKPGFHVLDYGCGPGSFSTAAAELVGRSGKVYAADINPLALQRVQSSASKGGLRNIETIHTHCPTGLADGSIDAILLYDTYHALADPDGVLRELHRVLKLDSILSFNDHHMQEGEILSRITSTGLFELLKKGERTYSFLGRDH